MRNYLVATAKTILESILNYEFISRSLSALSDKGSDRSKALFSSASSLEREEEAEYSLRKPRRMETVILSSQHERHFRWLVKSSLHFGFLLSPLSSRLLTFIVT